MNCMLLCPFPGVLWLWHFLYSVGPHPVSSLHIYTFVVSRAFMAGAASQAGDADSSRAPGLTSGLQGSVNVHRGALLFVPQWQCISSFVFYIKRKRKRSDSILWQKPLHQQKCQKGKVTTQTTPQKSSIKQRLRTDLGRSVGVTTATQLVWLTGLRAHLPTNRNSRLIKRTHV